MKDSTDRFTDRVSDYANYRPRYPAAMIRLLEERIGLRGGWKVADVGSGTGISSEPFLELGCEVTGVEPNRAMREAAEALYANRRNFRSLDGRAEATGLAPLSVDLYVSGQAFHWFDRAAARVEALRILREPKRGLLMWNDWRPNGSPFLRDYDGLLNARMPERAEADHRNLGPGDMDAFFGPRRWEEARLRNSQALDFEGLKGRLLSASYAPKPGDPRYEGTIAELKEIFDAHARGGTLDFGYETILYFGELA